MAIRVQQHARQATRRLLRANHPHAARAVEAAETRVRHAASSAPADIAFTHDPLTGTVTRHENGVAMQSGEPAGGGSRPLDLGAYETVEAGRPTPPSASSAPWGALEPAGIPRADATSTITPPVPAPTAVH